MIEETIQGIIVTALAVAPVLYIFLRRWVSRHQRNRERDARVARDENQRTDAATKRAAPAEGVPKKGLRRLFRRRRRVRPAPPLPPVSEREPQPIFDRLRPADDKSTARREAPKRLAEWDAAMMGESESPTNEQAGAALYATDSRTASRSGSAMAWRRIDRMSTLKRGIVLREILGPPRGLARGADSEPFSTR